MRFDLARSADPGARSSNDDRLVLVEHRRLIAGIVADGAPGHGGGDVAAQLDVVKIRLTGEEPLLREGIETLIRRLATPHADIAPTNNGSLLAPNAHALKQARVGRVTVSLDAIDDAAIAAGFLPLKINIAIEISVNSSQILPLARH
ncbi:hypothetical protein [Caballeronia glebae]|nr:hypothetical protein [Caballeronia glebae]